MSSFIDSTAFNLLKIILGDLGYPVSAAFPEILYAYFRGSFRLESFLRPQSPFAHDYEFIQKIVDKFNPHIYNTIKKHTERM